MFELKPYLEKISGHEDLTRQEAAKALDSIITDEISGTEIGALLLGLRMKGESVEEIVGFVDTMEKHMISVDLQDSDAIDVCGTGGDQRNSFNVSTTSALVAAAAGASVAKHGNRSVSSRCGSADVLEALGVKIDLGPEQVKQCIDGIGIGFFFAPLYHPAMKAVVPHRKNLGLRTVFNMLGPLLNPARVRRQLIGTFNLETAKKLAEVLKAREYRKACTVHSADGFDEVSPFAENYMFEISEDADAVREYVYHHECSAAFSEVAVEGSDPETNAQLTLAVLEGAKNANREMTVINAAFALLVAGKASNVEQGIQIAENAIDNGTALRKLVEFKEISNSF